VPHDGDETARVGYAITRRVGNAVTRNRLRRRLQAALSELARQNNVTLRSGLYLITPGPSVVPMSFPQLREALAAAFEKNVRRTSQTSPAR
jgi:ribonuclease P protein component